jgi:hypothetical protein
MTIFQIQSKKARAPTIRLHRRLRRSAILAEHVRTTSHFRPFLELMEHRTLLSALKVSSIDDSGYGSLRWAIEQAEADPGSDEIAFAIPGAGVHTITPVTPLPAITGAVLIDGTTQPGYAGKPLIEISGQSDRVADGLTITGSGTTVRGLVIDGFAFRSAILISGPAATGNVIEANFIGTDPTGLQARPSYFGVRIADGAHDNTVGGNGPADGNLIAYHAASGVVAVGDDSTGNRILGNRIFDNGDGGPAILQFDGSGNYVQLPSFVVGSGLTLEAWITSDNVHANSATIFDFGDGPIGDNIILYWDGVTGRMSFGIDGYSPYIAGDIVRNAITTSDVFPQSQWVHVAAVLDSNGNGAIYWDGQLVASGNLDYANSYGARANDYLGRSNAQSDSAFTGALTEVKIWSAAHTVDQVLLDMTSVPTGTEPDLQAYFRLDEGQGLTAHDLGPYHRDATIVAGDGSDLSWNGNTSARAQAIDLNGDGVTSNTVSPRQGPNDLQHDPVVVVNALGHYQGRLWGSLPDSHFHIEFFASSGYAPDGSGEAAVFLGSIEVTTDGAGQAVFDVPFTPSANEPFMTATATDSAGNTSEVSGRRQLAIQVPRSYVRFALGSPVVMSLVTGSAGVLEDPDAGAIDAEWGLSLSVASGTLALSNTAGLVGTGNGTGFLNYRGGLSELNAALDGMRFTPISGFAGKVIVRLVAESAGAQSVEGQLLLTGGVFSVSTTADSGEGSLRQAIADAILTSGPSTIRFAIPGPGVHTIAPGSRLPTLPAAIMIDGTSQPGYAGAPLIELSGQAAGVADGLTIIRSGITIRGLAIDGFAAGAGIVISGPAATGNSIQANFIGTEPTGSEARPNASGIAINGNARDNTIGGASAGAANLIAGNDGSGIVVSDAGSVGNRILSNRIFDNTQAQRVGLHFDGSGSYVSLPSFSLGGAFTLEAWVKSESVYASWARIFDFGDGPGANNVVLGWYAEQGKMFWGNITTTAVFPEGQWVHVAATVDAQGNGALYWNDEPVASGYVGQIPSLARANQYVGRSEWPGDAAFTGSIDDVKIWSEARTADQVRADSTAFPTGSEPSLEAYYPFDEGQGLSAHDGSPNHLDATLTTSGASEPVWNSDPTQGIDLNGDGPTANSASPRQGPNNLQNAPVVVTTAGGQLRGWLGGSLPNTDYHLEFFAGAGDALAGAGQAEVYLGSLEVTTNGAGQVTFDIPFKSATGKSVVVATATDPSGNTSEFSVSARSFNLQAPVTSVRVGPGNSAIFAAAAGSAVVLLDPDAGPLDPSWDLMLSVPAGSLRLSTTVGLVGTGDGTGTLHYHGGLIELNAALDGLRFTAPAGFHGQTTFKMSAGPEGRTYAQTQVTLADGIFTVTTNADSGAGSLRQAILDADVAGGTATVTFAISGSGVHTIAPVLALPAITAALLIDGTSQPGYAGSPLIELSGRVATAGDGLTIIGSGATARGLAINDFASGAAIVITGPAATGNVIEADLIGTDPTGLKARTNHYGVLIAAGAHDNTVGGPGPTDGNLIEFQAGSGVVILGGASTGNRIIGNRIYGGIQASAAGLIFDGSGAHVDVPNDPGLQFSAAQSFTVTASVDVESLPGQWSAIVAKSRDGWPWYGLWISPSNQWVGAGPILIYGPQVTLGRHSLALVQDGPAGTRTLFVDGVAAATEPAQDGNGSGDLWIGGASSANEYFNGLIDSAQVWSIALSADQIHQEMTAAPNGSEPGLEASYRFDEGTGTTAHDASSHHRDGTLAGPDGALPVWDISSPQAIDLGGDGLTASGLSPQQGPNDLQNPPVIVSTIFGRVSGRLRGSLPNSDYHLEFFASSDYRSDGSGEAELYLGSIDVTTDGSGQVTFDVPFTPPVAKPIVTATATDVHGNTSEFSHVRQGALEVPARLVPPLTGTALTFSSATGGAFVLSDPVAGALASIVNWDFTLSVTDGTLALAGTSGLTGTGDGTDSLNYRGTVSALNAALDGMKYTRVPGFQGLATVSVEAHSNGAAPVLGRLLIAFYQVTTTADAGPGSLRQAIIDADATPGLVTIDFVIPGTSVHTIAPLLALPPITGPVLIDGFSQPGYSGAPLIELRGQPDGNIDGLTMSGTGATVRGIAIDGFTFGTAIAISGPAATLDTIEANWIGTDPSGSQDHPNGFDVAISGGAHDNIVGGTSAAAGNLIAYDAGAGVIVTGSGSVDNRILGNRISTSSPVQSTSLSFDGSGSYVQLPSFSLGGAITFEAWVESDNVQANWARVFDFADGPGVNEIALTWVGQSGLMALFDYGNGGGYLQTSAVFPQGRWVHVAATVDDQGNGAIYWDGLQVASGPVVVPFVLSRSLMYLGRSNYASDSSFTGSLDDVKIWSGARTAVQIRADMTAVPSELEPALVSYFPFDEGSGATTVDSSASHLVADLATNGGIDAVWSTRATPAIELKGTGLAGGPLATLQAPNHDQNAPEIVTMDDGSHWGWLGGSLPNTSYHIEFFASADYEEADDYLGSLEVITDGAGHVAFDVPYTSPLGKPIISATATDPSGNTSEVTGLRQAALTIPSRAVPRASGASITFSAAAGNAIVLADPDAGPYDPPWDLSLSVAAGTLTLANTAGLSGSGDGTASLEFRGTAAAIDAALEGLRFTWPAAFQGLATVNLEAHSEGATAIRGQLHFSFFQVTTTANDGPGSLRSAIDSAVSAYSPWPSILTFAIPGPGIHTIAPLTALPSIYGSMLIDGWSQPGFAGTPLIEISGQGGATPGGLAIAGASVTVCGMTIDDFAYAYSSPSVLNIQSSSFPGSDGTESAGLVDSYRIDLGSDSLLVGLVHSRGVVTRLSLLDAQGRLLVLSDGGSLSGGEPRIDQHVAPGTYFLEVSNMGGDGDYTLSTTVTFASGPFQPVSLLAPPVPTYPYSFTTGDFNDDGIPDLAAYDGVHLGVGDGTFRLRAADFGAPLGAYSANGLISGDWNGDGRLDLAAVNFFDSTITLLLGKGDGTFGAAQQIATSGYPIVLVAGDFNGDGKLDLASGDAGNEILVMLGNGNGTFQAAQRSFIGGYANSIFAGDLNGDGKLDLVAHIVGVSGYEYNIAVLLGNGNGTFQPDHELAVGSYRGSLGVGDFNGDGRLDLAVSNDNDISVLLGIGDGTFEPEKRDVGVGASAYVATGDFNADGRLDLAIAGYVLLGNGDGTFEARQKFVGGGYELAPADYNGDGRLDLAVNSFSNDYSSLSPFNLSDDISVLLGKGDGTFLQPQRFAAGASPVSAAAGDFNGDRRLDVVTVNNLSNDVSVLLGNGDGTLGAQQQFAVGAQPVAVVTGDFNGDGRLDVAVANAGTNDISVLLGKGDGTFQPEVRFAAGTQPAYLLAGDFDGDGRLDLAVANLGSGDVSVLLGNGDGKFRAQRRFAFGSQASSLAAGDFNGDGWLDLATGSELLLGNNDGTFQPPTPFTGGGSPQGMGDFNGDGLPDRFSVNSTFDDVLIDLGNVDGMFVASSLLATAPYATPVIADWNGDGTADVFEINAAGEVLYRQGRPREPGTFDPPLTIDPGTHARDLAVVATAQGPMLAAVDDGSDSVSLYLWRAGSFVRVASLATGRLPAQIVAADVSGDGWADLVVRNAGDGTLSVFLSSNFNRSRFMGPVDPKFSPPSFLAPVALTVGLGVSDVSLVDTTGHGAIDIVVANKLTGQVSILRNKGDGSFASPEPYRAANGLSGLDTSSGSPVITSLEATSAVAAGRFRAGGNSDLVTINPGSQTVDLLAGLGAGRYANPVAVETQSHAQVVRAADFNHDGVSDLALLDAAGLSVLLGDGRGSFAAPTTYDVGPNPSGLSVGDVNHDGHLDLVVGDAFGDVLVLIGRGDGTFQPYRKTDQSVALAVADLNGDGTPEFVFADQGLDRVTVDYGGGRTAILADHSSGLLAPGAVQLADMNGDGIKDLIVANSGSNSILVYAGLGNGQFGPAVNGGHGFFAGTNPSGVTVADVNGDGKPDLLVANSGSNDVSVLLGQGTGTSWTLAPGPRIKTAAGPVATVVADLNGDGRLDLAVANQQANSLQIFPGVGGGFFNDQNPIVIPVGNNPGSIFIGNFDGKPDIVTVNAGSNDLSVISDYNAANPVIVTIPSGGLNPVTAFEFSSADGFDDLVVGNNGDGVLALFEGGPDGLALISTESDPNLPSPTDLAFATLTGGQVHFYAATEGRESAELVAFSLSGETPGQSQPSQSPESTLPTLVPLEESALALVATFLVLTVDSTEEATNLEAAETEAAASLAISSSASLALGQSLTRSGDDLAVEEEGERAGDSEDVGGDARSPIASAWERFMLGLDDALERFRNEYQRRNSAATEPKGVDRRTESQPPERSQSIEGPTSLRSAPIQPPEDQPHESSANERSSKEGQAIDAVIDALWEDCEKPSHQLELARRNDSIEHRSRALITILGISTIVSACCLRARSGLPLRPRETRSTEENLRALRREVLHPIRRPDRVIN